MPESLQAAQTLPRVRKHRWDREGKCVVAAHVEGEAHEEFKRLAADLRRSTDAMVHHALALLFITHKRPVPTAIAKKLRKLGISVAEPT
jgi:hypothetical protein